MSFKSFPLSFLHAQIAFIQIDVKLINYRNIKPFDKTKQRFENSETHTIVLCVNFEIFKKKKLSLYKIRQKH